MRQSDLGNCGLNKYINVINVIKSDTILEQINFLRINKQRI